MALELMLPTWKVLVVYPSKPIHKSWTDEVKKWDCDVNITYTTYISLKKYLDKEWDFVVFDEIHKASTRQWGYINQVKAKKQLAMTGTIRWSTRQKLMENFFPIILEYPIEKAIEDGIITDMKITIVRVNLDKHLVDKYKNLSERIEDMMLRNDKRLKFTALERMRLLHRSPNKMKVLKDMLKKFEDKRVLVFSSEMKLADQMGIPAYHSGNPDEQLRIDFCSGKGNSLVVLKMFNQGVTITPINLCIIHNFSSNPEELAQQLNRVTAYEYGNEDKVARVYLIVLKGTQEEKWAERSLEFIPKNKIHYYDYE